MAKVTKKKQKQKKGKKSGGVRPFCVTPKSTFNVQSFRVHWISADPSYDARYRLVPIINLFESDAETRHEGSVAFVQFRRDKNLKGTTHDAGTNVYYLDYPLEMIDSILTLLGSGSPLEIAYFEQDGRKWADLRTPFLVVGDDDLECDEEEPGAEAPAEA
jgi:hypothetical protein